MAVSEMFLGAGPSNGSGFQVSIQPLANIVLLNWKYSVFLLYIAAKGVVYDTCLLNIFETVGEKGYHN